MQLPKAGMADQYSEGTRLPSPYFSFKSSLYYIHYSVIRHFYRVSVTSCLQ